MSHKNLLYDINGQIHGGFEPKQASYPTEKRSHNTKGEGGMPKNGAQIAFFAALALPVENFMSKIKKYSGLEDH